MDFVELCQISLKSGWLTYHQDGNMRFDGNFGGAPNYEPNSMGGPVEDARYLEPPLKVSGDAARYDHRQGNDDYKQPGALFRLMNPSQKEQLFNNLSDAMEGVPERIDPPGSATLRSPGSRPAASGRSARRAGVPPCV